MKSLLFIVYLSISLPVASAQSLDFINRSVRDYDYYVKIAGQSNGVGLATNPAAYSLTGVIPFAVIKNVNFGGIYEALQLGNNQANCPTCFGTELSMGKYLGAAIGHNIYIGKTAVNGAALADVPGTNDFTVGGTIYNTLVGSVSTDVAAIPASARPLKRVFVWLQGERDAQGETGQPTLYSSVYASNFATWFATLESTIGFKWDMVVICRISENQRVAYGSVTDGFDQLVTQQNLIVANGGARYRIINTDNFYTGSNDEFHYNNHGQNYLGEAVAKTILGEAIATVSANPAWAPTMYSGCKLDLDAKQGVTLTSGKVSQWNDQSTGAHNATQATAGNRPTYGASSDRIIFNSANSTYLNLDASINDFKNDTQGEFIVVYRRTNTAANNYIVSVSNTTVSNSYYDILVSLNSGGTPNRVWSQKQSSTTSQVYTSTEVSGSNIILSVANNTYGFKAWNGSAHESPLVVSSGAINETNWLANFSTAHNAMTIGGHRTNSTIFSTFELYRIVYFDRMLKYEERQAIYTYLANYHGLGISPVDKQVLWDQIAAIADLGHGPATTNGQGGFFKETTLTTQCASGDEIKGLRSFGINKPSTHNLPYAGNTSLTPGNGTVWSKDLTVINIGPRYIDNGNWDRYMEIYNGTANAAYFETAGSFIAKTQPLDFITFGWYPPQTADEGTNRVKALGPPATQHLSAIDGWSPDITLANGNNYIPYRENVVRILTRADNTWQVWVNGVSKGTGTGVSFSTTEWIWGTNSHALGMHLRANLAKFGEFTTDEINLIYGNSQVLWPWNVEPSFPYIKEIHYGDASVWNGTNKTFEPGRGKTISFVGGSGVEGATKYMWYWALASDDIIATHYQIPASVDINGVGAGDIVTQIDVDGFNLMSAPVNYTTSVTATADLVVANIDAFQTKFDAERTSTGTILLHPIGVGSNLYAINNVTTTETGFTAIDLDAPRSAFLDRDDYAVDGQIFYTHEGDNTRRVMRVTYPIDSNGLAGPPQPMAWIIDNIP